MSWNTRISQPYTVSGSFALDTFDSRALQPSDMQATLNWPAPCAGGIIQATMVAFAASAPVYVQAVANAAPSGSTPTWSITIYGTKAGDLLVLDIAYSYTTSGVITVAGWSPCAQGGVSFNHEGMQTWSTVSPGGDVTVTAACASDFTAISAVVTEYGGATNSYSGVYGDGVVFGVGNPISLSIGATGNLLHLAASTTNACGDPPVLTGGGYASCFPAWLVILEPGTASPYVPDTWTDQSGRLHLSEQITFSWIVKQRGTAKIPLYIEGGDDYLPTIGSQICLWDTTEAADFEVFSGTIDDYEIKWAGQNGDKFIEVTAVSLEQIFDTIRVPSMLFTDQTAGYIVEQLFALATGSPVTLGTVEAGETIANFLISDFPSISDVFDRLATLSEYVWGVNPQTGQLYFTPPDIVPSPFTLESGDVLWEEFTLKKERHDYRNRQILQVDKNAAVQSSEYFVGAGQSSFTLLRPVEQVTYAWITQNIQNSATGSFSGQPNPGDTITFGYAQTPGSLYSWQAVHYYETNEMIVDGNGNVQRNLGSAGWSGDGPAAPVWGLNYGDITSDGPATGHSPGIDWTNQGPAGFGSGTAATYTFVAALDNTQFGEVLIGADVAHTAQNLADAINAVAAQAGLTFSLPTWENPIVNADEPAGLSTIVVRNKAAGASNIAALSWTGSSFSFNAAFTFGGTTTYGTVPLTVVAYGQTASPAPGSSVLQYQPGSATVSLATPLNSGSNLQVQYLAQNASYIQVEDTGQVEARALIEAGTGKYQQQSSDANALTLPQGLQLAQQQLAAYAVIPQTFEFTTFRPGLYVGQVLNVAMETPAGIGDLVNGSLSPMYGNWFIQEINAELLPVYGSEANPRYLPDGAGHYRYTVRTIDVTQVGSWIDFWEGLSGGGGSASGAVFPGGGTLGQSGSTASSYTAAITAVAGTALIVAHGLNNSAVVVSAYDGNGNLMSIPSLTVTDPNTVTATFGISFTGTIVIIGA